MTLVFATLAAIVGIFIGGVLNWLADYLPNYEIPGQPRYPDGTPRPPSAWWGITAFITGSRCPTNTDRANCLPWRYPITEVATAIAFFATVLRIEAINVNTPQLINGTQSIFYLFYIAVFVLIVVIDVEHHLILFNVILPSSAVALLDALLTPAKNAATVSWWQASLQPTLTEALIGAALGFGVFSLFYWGGALYLKISKAIRGWAPDEVPFGYGDVMLITLCGLILGWRPLIFAMFLTVFLGAFGALIVIIYSKLRRRGGGMQIALPYGPYIVAGVVLVMLFNSWVQWLVVTLAY